MTKYIFTRDLPPSGIEKGDVADGYSNTNLGTWLALGYIEEVKEGEWPKYGDSYYFVNDRAEVWIEPWVAHAVDFARKAVGNCYRTEAEALQEKIRVERAYKGI